MNIRMRLLLALATVGTVAVTACSGGKTTATSTPQPTSTTVPSGPTEATTAVPAEPVGGVDVAWEKVIQPQADVLAQVNGVGIGKDAYLKKLRRQLYSVTADYSLNWYDEETVSYLPSFQDQVLQLLVNEELARQLAGAEGIVVDAAARQAELEKAKTSALESGQYSTWEDFLKAYGSTQEEIEEDINQYLIYQGLIKTHGGPTEAEQVHAVHILVDTEDKGKEVLSKLAAGTAFADLAKEYSTDTGSGAQGGDLGWFPRGAMVPEFEEAAFSLGIGETSGLVQSQYGYHVIRVLEKSVRPLDAQFLQESQQTALQAWFSAQLEAASVQTLVTFAAPTPSPTP
jgi:parvulin-like peptidyl-prolyl isomerase